MLLALLLSQLAVQPSSPVGPIFSSPATMGQLAFFEAFPSNGRGTAGVCSTSAPTGAKGEALTFTRASNGTCTKTAAGGFSTTGIADGDLVVLSSNQPRVMYDANGVLGLLVESSRTNSLPRSEAIDNAAWTKTAGGTGSVPTVTADFAVAPDGTTTAERVQFSACPTTGSSVIQGTGTSQAGTATFYLKGNGTSGNVRLVSFSGGGPGQDITTLCPFVSGSWSRCTQSNTSGAAGTIVLGCVNLPVNYGGSSDTGAADVLVWGAQWEAGQYATSYTGNTGAGTLTRSADAAYFAVSLSTASGFSHAHSMTLEGPSESYTGSTGIYQDALNRTQLTQFSTNALGMDLFSTSGNRSITSVPGLWLANTTYRLAGSYTGAGASSAVSTYLAGVLQATSPTGLTSTWTATQYGMSLNSPWNTGMAIYSRLCLDPSQTRCR